MHAHTVLCLILINLVFATISGPPVLTIFPSADRDVVIGENLVATCQASGNPTPMIEWFKDDMPLYSGNQSGISISPSTGSRSQLTVLNFANENQGEYICVGVNNLGNDTRSFKVNAAGKL